MESGSENPHIIQVLGRLSRQHLHDRKLLVCQSPAQGRELLRGMALAGIPWMGWEVATPRTLAHALVLPALSRSGYTTADDFDRQALADAAIDAVEARGDSGPFAGTGGASGYREAIRRTLESLREGGVTPGTLRRARPGDPKLAALAAFLEEMERIARDRRLLDGPGIMEAAREALEAGTSGLPDAAIFVLSGQSLRGRGGAFLRTLLRLERVSLIEVDSVIGLPTPPALAWQAPSHPTGPLSALHAPERAGAIPAQDAASGGGPGPAPTISRPPHYDLFAATSPADEIREVLRRVVHAGLPWDQVEIVATDPITYGAVLDGLARQLEIPVTYSRGLDSRRTRTGRAVEAYLRWIAGDFPADLLRSMLESGDVGPPATHHEVAGASLARRLRRLRIGWGRHRYLEVVDQALEATESPAAGADGVDPEFADHRRVEERRELVALRALLSALLDATPEPRILPAESSTASRPGPVGRISPSGLAAGVLAFLDLVPMGAGIADRTMRKVMQERLIRIRDTLTRQTGWDAAIAILQSGLVTRVAARGEGGLAPWTSTNGHLHLSDLSTGGLTLRPHLFVVGLDAGRVTGTGGADPLLTDTDRSMIDAVSGGEVAPVATTGERAAEARHALATTLARLRGRITLSYSAGESAEGRATSPAPELLQALRLREGDGTLTYDRLRSATGRLAGAVPEGRRHLDTNDLWLDALADGQTLREGTGAVRTVFHGLDAGLSARDARAGSTATVHDGVIGSHPELDPRVGRTVLSATRLEALGTCPRRYFYQYVLRVAPPRDPVLDSEVWLDPLDRGALLHAVYESALRIARQREIDYDDPTFAELAAYVFEEEAERMLLHAPPPSDAVAERERDGLRQEIETWVAMIRRDRPDWIEVELRFGPGEREAEVEVAGGTVRLRGAIDRIDRHPEGALRVVDYKTGSFTRYRQRIPFAGGRRIQHVLYTLATEHLLDMSVDAMEYHFPTLRGEMRRISYGREALARGEEVLEQLFTIAASGHFVTTEDSADCRFCDFAAVCRVTEEGFGKVTSGRAAWAKAVGLELPEFEGLRALRGLDV